MAGGAQAEVFTDLIGLDDLIGPEHVLETPLPFRARLPRFPSSFVGRRQELQEVVETLRNADVRLLTLTGSGGAGKTRLALQAAHSVEAEFPGGAAFVPLASLTDPAQIPSTVARALAIEEQPDVPTVETLARELEPMKVLLVLDNLEHLLAGVGLISHLLAAAPQLKVLATSRATLRLSGEREYRVSPLPIPGPEIGADVDVLMGFDSVALLVERAQAWNPDFSLSSGPAAIAEACRRLDGLPLALELAAARLTTLAPDELLVRLKELLALPGARDLPERQQTLRATIEWSYGLLDQDVQRLFDRLAIFRGGFTLAAAEAVCSATVEAVTALVETNLLRRRGNRFATLSTIYEFALEQLERQTDTESLRRRHAEYLRELAEAAERRLQHTDPDVIDELEAELDNLRAAVSWGLEADPEAAAAIVTPLARFLQERHPAEGRRWLESLDRRAERLSRPVAAQIWKALGAIAYLHGDLGTARDHTERAALTSEELGDAATAARAFNNLGAIHLALGDIASTRASYERSIALHRASSASEELVAVPMSNLVQLAMAEGDYGGARGYAVEALRVCRDQALSSLEAATMMYLAEIALIEGDVESARAQIDASLQIRRARGEQAYLGDGLRVDALVALREGRVDEAERKALEAFEVGTRLGLTSTLIPALETLADVLLERKEPLRATTLRAAAGSLREQLAVKAWVPERYWEERALGRIDAELGEATRREAWDRGRSLSPYEALEAAGLSVPTS